MKIDSKSLSNTIFVVSVPLKQAHVLVVAAVILDQERA
jgi:hypothetical protein